MLHRERLVFKLRVQHKDAAIGLFQLLVQTAQFGLAGTEFSVLLPVSRTSSRPAPVSAARESGIVGAGRRVLVVDDEAGVRLVTTQVLRRRGFEVVTAEDGLEGLKRLRATPGNFSVVIMDLMMPGMNGYALAREIRSLAPALPIVVASGMMGDAKTGEDRASLTAIGVQAILTKPFGEADLIEALNAAMGTPQGAVVIKS